MWIVNQYNPYKYIPNGGYSVGIVSGTRKGEIFGVLTDLFNLIRYYSENQKTLECKKTLK